MKHIFSLNGTWKMKPESADEWLDAEVPGSVLQDMLGSGKIQDPFWRCNEHDALAEMDQDYVYKKHFSMPDSLSAFDKIILCCDGLDTLAEIHLNGHRVGMADNMHRQWQWDVLPFLCPGSNEIEICFRNALAHLRDAHRRDPETWTVANGIAGSEHLRKAHHSFGWDWGPRLPDAGIWRSIRLSAISGAALGEIRFEQIHQDAVVLRAHVSVDAVTAHLEDTALELMLTHPDGSVQTASAMISVAGMHSLEIAVSDPQLWWPQGLGAQPLYVTEIRLVEKSRIADSQTLRLGLRTLTVNQTPDTWGKSFAFCVNGVSFFAMGADYIPEDSLLGRCSPQRTRRLLEDAVLAHHNCIRVWGGGIYPEDWFFDLCDELGLVVWQDLMFACATYRMTPEFTENIRQEAIDNLRRIRHHASLGLLCGNNEMEWGWEDWGFNKTPELRADYLKQFEWVLAGVAAAEAPDTFWWPASPSSGGCFRAPNDDNTGDVHYWEVWHGNKPFSEYRNHFFRFCSEFGFESFPELRTLESCALPEDMDPFSPVMEHHQKCVGGNAKIMTYLTALYRMPQNFDQFILASQLQHGEALAAGVEHWRRHRNDLRCMGAVYWQLNDCWPVVSWASIDYAGRWKAAHYMSRRFFAPVLLSGYLEKGRLYLNISNETMQTFSGVVRWRLCRTDGTVIAENSLRAEVPALNAIDIVNSALPDCVALWNGEPYLPHVTEDQKDHYVVFGWDTASGFEPVRILTAVPPKSMRLCRPDICTYIEETETCFRITLTPETLVLGAWLSLKDTDALFSDNAFDLAAGVPVTVCADKDRLSLPCTLESFRQQLSLQCLNDWHVI